MHTKQIGQVDDTVNWPGAKTVRGGWTAAAGFAAAILLTLVLTTLPSSPSSVSAGGLSLQATPEIVQITHLATDETPYLLNISGDGKQVLYTVHKNGVVNDDHLYRAASDGSGSPQLIAAGLVDNSRPEMSYDGSKVVWNGTGNMCGLLVNGVDISPYYYHAAPSHTWDEYHCLDPVSNPKISGDGQSVFFESTSSWNCKWDNNWEYWDCALPEALRLWRIPSGGGSPVIVLDFEDSYNGLDLHLNYWEVDHTGKTIAVSCDDGDARYGMCVFQSGHFYGFVQDATDAWLSPDGDWLVWEEGGYLNHPILIHVLKLDGSQMLTFESDTSLENGSNRRFMSDDAGKFLYDDYGDGLWLMNRDGSGRTQIVASGLSIGYSLSYSGQDIAFESSQDLVGNGNDQSQIFTRLGPPLPDLSVDPFALAAPDVTLINGKYILPVDVIVWNVGEADVAQVPVRFSDDSGWSSTQTIADLGAGISTTLHLDWDITDIITNSQGASTVQLTARADPDSTLAEKTHLNNQYTVSTTVDVRPRIQVQPELDLAGSYFLAGASINNRIRVAVDWNGDLSGNGAPGNVYFNLNGTQVEQAGQAWGATHTYDMGSDFESNYLCANNTLRIFATAPTGIRSLDTVLQPTVFPAPAWWEWLKTSLGGGFYDFSGQAYPPLVKYTHDYRYPVEPFVANWNVPGWVPYLGGKPMGILQSQASSFTTSWSNGAGQSKNNGQTGFQVGGMGIMGQIYGSGETQFVCGQSLTLNRADINLKITGLIEKEQGLADLVPGLKAAENWAVVGRYVKWLNRVALVKGRLMPGVNIKTSYETRAGELQFNPSEGTAFVATQAVLEITPFKDLMMDIYGGGKPYLTIAVPADPDYFKSVGIQMYYGADLRVFCFQQTFEHQITCNYPGGCDDPLSLNPHIAAEPQSAWHLIPRKDPTTMRLQTSSVLQATGTTTETVLVSPTYIRLEPALAVADAGTRLLTYVDDDLNDPAGRSTEIRARIWDDSWDDIALTDDQQSDFAPAVAFDGSGNGLVAWEHATLATSITPTLNITFVQSLEIAARTWVSSTATWGNVVTLTNNSLMDHALRLSAGNDGSVMAMWQTNDGTDILGTAAHPLTFTYAIWNGSGWNAPAAAITGLHDVLGTAFAAYSSTQAALVYAVDADGWLTTTNDSDLYYATFDGASWGSPIRIMTDTITDTTPALAYDEDGNLHLLWLRARPSAGAGQALVWLENSWDIGDARTVRTTSTEAGFLGFTLSRASNGNLSLVWQTMDENGSNLAYSVYDAAHDSWGTDQPLMSDADVEGSHSPAFGSDGTLYLAYQKTETQFITKTLSSASATFTVTNVPTRGASSLAFLEHTVGIDLALDSLTITPTNPAPGTVVTLTAVLRNAGDLAVVTPQVAFYDGTMPFITRTLAITLAAGYTDTLRTNWIVPSPAAVHTLKAVADPNAQVTENDEANNEITLQTVLPDLQVEVFYTAHNSEKITATARLVNAGVLTATAPFTVAFRAADPLTGTLLGTVAVQSDIGVDEQITVTLTLSNPASLAGLGDLLWAIADEGDTVTESDEGNNSNTIRLAVLPDLTLTAADITADNGPAVITIHNIGVITATAPVIAVRQDGPTGTLVYSGTLNTLAAGESDAVMLSSVAGQVELWAYADPGHRIAESDESNNLAIREMAVAFRVYLPLVLRSYAAP